MNLERAQAKLDAERLACWCDDMRHDNECGEFWKRQLKAIAECLRALAADEVAMPRAHAKPRTTEDKPKWFPWRRA